MKYYYFKFKKDFLVSKTLDLAVKYEDFRFVKYDQYVYKKTFYLKVVL